MHKSVTLQTNITHTINRVLTLGSEPLTLICNLRKLFAAYLLGLGVLAGDADPNQVELKNGHGSSTLKHFFV